MKRLELKIYGQVQGVFFRAATKNEADKLGLGGWASNESDETVKIVIEGEEEVLKKFLDWCKIGTELAKVERVEVKWDEVAGEFNSFQIRY